MPPDTRKAEKEYLSRAQSSVWEQSKPFSPRGCDTLNESAALLHDFAVAMLTLQPDPEDLVLDLGAGGCWCSDLLARLNRSSIAVDISIDMLRAGRSRSGVAIRAVTADMESLPFQSAVFRRAVCLNSLHHVPNTRSAVKEVARVLTDDGVALFSEPGEGHADEPMSSVAVKSYGVLEQSILLGPFMRDCHAAGFEDVSVLPLCYAIPGFAISSDQWDQWSLLANSKRPRRAISKLRLAVMEFFGLGKKGPLFEETLAVSMVRALRQVVGRHPLVVARKTRPSAMVAERWRASMNVEVTGEVSRGAPISVEVQATNVGAASWRPATSSGIGTISLGVQLLDPDGLLITRDYHRVVLPHVVAPGQGVTMFFDCPSPQEPGLYLLKFDFVSEGTTWFELAGSPTVSKPLRVL
jgi:SAM-dependent methyltransferase